MSYKLSDSPCLPHADAILSPAECRRVMGVGMSKVYDELASGRLVGTNTRPDGKRPRWRVSGQAVRDWFDANSNAARSARRHY